MKSIPLMLLFLFLVGCSPEGSQIEYVERTDWFEFGSGWQNLKTGCNFYTMDLDRYPETGFVTHSVDVDVWNQDSEHEAIVAAIKRCRGEFAKSYVDNEIVGHDSLENHKSKWIAPANAPFVTFSPKYVVIVIRNIHDLERFAKYEEKGVPPEKIPVEELLFPYKVGYLFESGDLFSELSIEELVPSGFRDESPLQLDKEANVPAHEDVYTILDHYRSKKN